MNPIDPSREKADIEGHDPLHWGFHGVVLLFVMLGVFIVVLAEVRARSPFWKDVGLIIGGLLIGFISLSVDEQFRARPERIRARKEHEEERRQHEEERKTDRDELAGLQAQNQTLLEGVRGVQGVVQEREQREVLLSQTETDNAYYLGYLTTVLPVKTASITHNLPYVRALCRDLGLQFSEEEQRTLNSALIKPGEEESEAAKVAEIVLSRAQDIRPPVRCFFLLGNKVAWLVDYMASAHSSREVLEEFESLHANPFLQMDPRYARVVHELLGALRPYREIIPDDARESFKQEVLQALAKVPPVYVHGGSARIPVQGTDWIWVKDADNDEPVAIRVIGKHAVVALNANTYEVLLCDNPELKAHITRDAAGWHCSAHPNATEQQACFEIRLVLDASDGGKPVTEARVVGKRKDSDNQPDL